MQTDSRDLINLVRDYGDLVTKMYLFPRPVLGSNDYFQIKFRLEGNEVVYMVIPEEFREVSQTATLEQCLQYSVETTKWQGFNILFKYN